MGRYGSVEVAVHGDRIRYTLRGEIDAGLELAVQQALDAGDPHGSVVEVDARLVTFMDCYGLRMLTSLAGRAQRVVLLGPPQILRFLLEVTGLGEDVRIEDEPATGTAGVGTVRRLDQHLAHRPDRLAGARSGVPSAPSPTTQRM